MVIAWVRPLLLVAALAGRCFAEAQHNKVNDPSNAAPAPVHLLAMGDWGEDTPAQRAVAKAMADHVRAMQSPPDSLLLLGDNFYFRLTGVDDPRWKTVFEDVYDPAVLSMPFYACLGNHDYDGSNHNIELAYAQLHPQGRFKLPADWYRIDLPIDKPTVTILMLDSNRDNLSPAQWNAQNQWLESELQKPRATWTICLAHHPLISNGFFWANGVLQRDWGSLFKTHRVDFYLCGHEHDMEHLEDDHWPDTSFVIAGGGGAHPHPLSRDDRGFSRVAFGFVDFNLTEQLATVSMIGTDGNTMHEFERSKAGIVRMLHTTPNTPRTNPLRALLQREKAPPATQPGPGSQ